VAKRLTALVSGPIVSISRLRVEITSIACGLAKGANSVVNGSVSSSIFITQRDLASAVEMERGDGGGGKGHGSMGRRIQPV